MLIKRKEVTNMGQISISHEILDFLTGIHGDRSNPSIRKSEIFDRAFSLAYKDMSTHTVAYTKVAETYTKKDCTRCANNKKLIQKALQNFISPIFQDLSSIKSQDDFQKWHKESCNHIVGIKNSECIVKKLVSEDNTEHDENYASLVCHKDKAIEQTFTYGQAQKLLNMMLKYLYIYYKCEGWNEFDTVADFYHAPIDRFVLRAALGQDNYNGIPWSKISTYSEYEECQAEINKKDNVKKYFTAFIWELTGWPFSSNQIVEE